MPRSNWKGNISFGLVSIPIELYNSIDPSSSVSFKQINKKTGSLIKYKRVDAETEKEVPWEQIGKGYPYSKEIILPVEEDELKRVAGENARTIAIEEFVDQDNIDFINVDHTYYLVPDKKAEKGYVILREALRESGKVGIAKVIISTKEYLAAVAVYENALVLYLLHYADQIRSISDFDIPSDDVKKYKIKKPEVEMAKKLITSMSVRWKPQKYKDDYKEVVEKWAEAKVKHHKGVVMTTRTRAKRATNVVDFVDLLKKSLGSSAAAKKVAKKVPAKRSKSTHHRVVHH